MIFYVFVGMLFLHIVDDFYLQSNILVSLKQRSWWQRNAPDSLYKHDYIVALIMHSISWTTMIMIPVFAYRYFNGYAVSPLIIIVYIINIMVHAFIDDQKANKMTINLVLDQSIHMLQIIGTFMACIV